MDKITDIFTGSAPAPARTVEDMRPLLRRLETASRRFSTELSGALSQRVALHVMPGFDCIDIFMARNYQPSPMAMRLCLEDAGDSVIIAVSVRGPASGVLGERRTVAEHSFSLDGDHARTDINPVMTVIREASLSALQPEERSALVRAGIEPAL